MNAMTDSVRERLIDLGDDFRAAGEAGVGRVFEAMANGRPIEAAVSALSSEALFSLATSLHAGAAFLAERGEEEDAAAFGTFAAAASRAVKVRADSDRSALMN